MRLSLPISCDIADREVAGFHLTESRCAAADLNIG